MNPSKVVALTSCVGISQLFAHSGSISAVPGAVTHSSPLVINAHLHSSLILSGPFHQSNCSICAVIVRCVNCIEHYTNIITKLESVNIVLYNYHHYMYYK